MHCVPYMVSSVKCRWCKISTHFPLYERSFPSSIHAWTEEGVQNQSSFTLIQLAETFALGWMLDTKSKRTPIIIDSRAETRNDEISTPDSKET